MSCSHCTAQTGAMHIEIEAGSTPPPCGDVVVDGSSPQEFAGWLELLAILTEALPPAAAESATQRLGGQLDA